MNATEITKRLSDNADKYEHVLDEYVKEVFGENYEHMSQLTDNEFRLVVSYASNLITSSLNYKLQGGIFYTKD